MKCGVKTLLYIDCKEEEEKEQETSQAREIEEITPTISCHALAGIRTPKNIKIKGYIKTKKETILIDSGSTHNFIHCKLSKILNCFIYPAREFQVMIVDGGTINFSRECHNINLNMGEYVLNILRNTIPMGGANVTLRV